MRYLFEEYAFDTARRELCRGPDVIAVTPQVFDLLAYLIRHRERVVTKDDLVGAIWNGRIVSDSAMATRILDDIPGGVQFKVKQTFELDGGEKPADVAEAIARAYVASEG